MPSDLKSVGMRVLVVGIVICGALGYYEYGRSGPSRSNVPTRRAYVLAWEEARRPFWKSLSYTSLSDEAGIREGVNSAIAKSALLGQLKQESRSKLADTLFTFLTALGATSPDKYLQSISPLRRLRDTPENDAHLLLSFKLLTGSPLNSRVGSREVLDRFWQGRPDIPSRLTAVSIADPRGSAFSVDEWDGSDREKWRYDDNVMRDWSNEASSAFVRTTVCPESSQAIVKQFGVVQRVGLDVAAVGGDQHYVPIHIRLFWSPNCMCWRAEDVFVQTDELLFWPI